MKHRSYQINKSIYFAFVAVFVFGTISCGQATPDPDVINTAIAQTQLASTDQESGETQMPPPTNTPQPSPTPLPPTSTPEPTVQASVEELWSKNYVGVAESGGLIIEIARVLVGYKWAIPGLSWEDLNDSIQGWAETEVVGELIFKVTNNTDRTVSVYPDQGTVQVGSEQIDLTNFMFYTTFGDNVGGDIYPGVTKIGGIWFGIRRSSPEEITQIIYRASPPFDSDSFANIGPGIEIVIDVPIHVWEEIPEELK